MFVRCLTEFREAPFYCNEEFHYSRRFEATMNRDRTPREMAIAWAQGWLGTARSGRRALQRLHTLLRPAASNSAVGCVVSQSGLCGVNYSCRSFRSNCRRPPGTIFSTAGPRSGA
jgi:hypothetical protein